MNQEQLLGLIWGVSAGLLSLVAVLGFYVAISSQQKIEKCRAVLWELFSSSKTSSRTIDHFRKKRKSIIKSADFLRDRYSLYKYLEEHETSQSLSFAIWGGMYLLVLVGVLWGLGFYLIAYQFSLMGKISMGLVYIGLISGIGFTGWEIYKLRSWRDIDQLPAANSLLDVNNNDEEFNVLNLLMATIYLSNLKIDVNTIKLDVVTPLQFYNYQLKCTLKVIKKDCPELKYNTHEKVEICLNEKYAIDQERHTKFKAEMDNKIVIPDLTRKIQVVITIVTSQGKEVYIVSPEISFEDKKILIEELTLMQSSDIDAETYIVVRQQPK